jgi:hypothetical protein
MRGGVRGGVGSGVGGGEGRSGERSEGPDARRGEGRGEGRDEGRGCRSFSAPVKRGKRLACPRLCARAGCAFAHNQAPRAWLC